MEEQQDGLIIPQLKTCTYSKPTDIHHYIEPNSCTPNLNKRSPAIIKGVAHRLRLTNTRDDDFLASLNKYSGYLVASGYDKLTVLKYFSDILSTSNRTIAFRVKEPDNSFKIAFTTKLHPALPNIRDIFERFYYILSACPVSSVIFPRISLLVAYRKLPSLAFSIAGNPFSIPQTPSLPRGFHRTPGCSCKLCMEATFASVIHSNSTPDRGFSLPAPISCTAVNVVYLLSCHCGLQYVGKTYLPKGRWSNHKSHIRKGYKSCSIATHCSRVHSELMVGDAKLSSTENIKSLLTLTLLQSVGRDSTEDDLASLEEVWRNRLQCWAPQGLNLREDGPSRLRKKK